MFAFCNLQIREEISDVTQDIQKVVGQIRNCDSKLHQATFCLDILSQRPRHELCLDQVSVRQADTVNMMWLQSQILC